VIDSPQDAAAPLPRPLRDDPCALILARIAEDLGMTGGDPPAVRAEVRRRLHSAPHGELAEAADELCRFLRVNVGSTSVHGESLAKLLTEVERLCQSKPESAQPPPGSAARYSVAGFVEPLGTNLHDNPGGRRKPVYFCDDPGSVPPAPVAPDLLVDCAQGFVPGWTESKVKESVAIAAEHLREGLRRVFKADTIGDARKIVVRTLGEEFLATHYAHPLEAPADSKS
jgi:hypothetical protein